MNPTSGTLLSQPLIEALGQSTVVGTTWQWNPFQEEGLRRQEFEVFCGGGKYGGKSALARGFLIKGNPHLPSVDPQGIAIPVNLSYVYHPNYRATILRRNQNDLDDFLRKFRILSEPYGGRYVRGMFEFPSGAVIACGHLADKDSWQKYIGVENVRFVVEEAALIPDFELLDQIRSCCRSIWPEMIPQILLTSNAGGPGTGHLIERFYEAKDPEGNIILPGQTIHEEVEVEDVDGSKIIVDKTRVFLFSTYRDNPHAKNDPGYIGTLATIRDDKTRAAYLDGDWKRFAGSYFSMFRPKGPATGEPPHAQHVIPPNPSLLKPWFHRLGSIDVGWTHKTVVLWGCDDPLSHQFHIYRELAVSETSYVQIGYEIAQRSLTELEQLPSHSMTFFISPDAIRKVTEQKTIVELIMQGIAKKIGPEAVYFPELELAKFRDLQSTSFLSFADEQRQWREVEDRLKSQRRSGITLRMATNDRIIGWQYCRESLRFTPISTHLPPFDQELHSRLYIDEPRRAAQYLSLYSHDSHETLPKLQIWDYDELLGPLWGAPSLIKSIPKARHGEPPENPEDVTKKHFEGADECDSWRYLMCGYEELPVEEPYEALRDRTVNAYLAANPTADTSDLIWVHRHLESQHAESQRTGPSFNLPRKNKVMRLGGPARFAQLTHSLITNKKPY